ncbi:alpha/beta fold hydrolase [Vibrio sp. LaRot3]|uniref:alpha/beta fold hydrolase n=1 Tax=Vibrio sp. LaRot3 TaxID=2998829 RepID=UPI0022CDEE08|nr:alpha/beta fold hydrolase [Vibrio sp. LaRot3]MDA0150325.1 alpha/beta fold hydrolase [Vibrio sp. LaRot3]
MTNPSAHSMPPYTQESEFEQAIQHNIAELWQRRNEGFIKTKDKKKLFWISLTSSQHTKAIVVVNGRIECTHKYQELFYDLYQQGYDVYSYDHRGQGLSDRLIEDPQMGYVEEFADYIDDIELLVESFKLDHYKKRYLLGHSMGGNIVTRYIQTHPNHPFDALAITAPMFGVNMAWYLRPIASLLGQVLTAINSKPTYAPGQAAYYPKPFTDNRLSQSSLRYHWFRDLYEQMPKLKIGGASTRWVWQGLMASKQCILLTRQIKVPLLLLQASDDQIVSNSDQIRFMKKLAKTNHQCAMQIIHGARHELLFEQDQYRNQTLDTTLAFFAQH